MKLTFYDHDRQSYAGVVPKDPAHEAEFQIVHDPDGDGGVGYAGEFKLSLHRFVGHENLAVQVHAFGDATNALNGFLKRGREAGINPLEDVESAEQFTFRLLALNIRDVSDTPMLSPAERRLNEVAAILEDFQSQEIHRRKANPTLDRIAAVLEDG